MSYSNRELIKIYKEKHKLEPVLFSQPWNEEKGQFLDGIVVPLKLDLRQYCSPSDDQGKTSHCAAFSAAQILEALYWKETGKVLQIDAAHIYAKAKEIDNATDTPGTYPEITLRCGLELANEAGMLDRNKYAVRKLYAKKDPSATVETIKRTIHKNGFLAAGFKITEDWYRLCEDGVSMLETSRKRDLGGHCVVAVGYLKDSLIVQNSWGKEWGSKGFGRIAWDVVAKQFVYAAYLERI